MHGIKLGIAYGAVLAFVAATLPACGVGVGAILDSGGSESTDPGGGDPLPLASIRPLTIYHPAGPTGPFQTPYWVKHLPNTVQDFAFEVEFDRPVPRAGAMLWFELSGDAEPGIHYSVSNLGPISLSEGETELRIPVALLSQDEFFLEKRLILELTQASGMELHERNFRAELCIRPSVDPPTLTFGSVPMTGPPGFQINVPLSLSHVSQEPVAVHYKVAPGSTLGDFEVAPSGTLYFSPGQTSSWFPFRLGTTGASGEFISLEIQHERNGVRFVVPPVDSFLTSNTDLFPQEIHTDENMWTYSVGGVQTFEQDDTVNPAPRGPSMPGVPSDNITGGSNWEPGMRDRQLVDLVDQANPNPIVDPFSGVPLKMYTIAEAATGVMPYLRKSFNSSFCGGNTQLYTLPEYARISYYIRMPEGPDAWRGIPFARIGMRFRSLNLNHGVTFRIGSEGFDSDGNPVPVVSTSMGPIGLWRTDQTTPNTDRFGVVEDEFGVRLWYAHKLDPTQPWTQPGGATVFEQPGVTSGNPIEYPTWLSPADGSFEVSGVSSIDDATGRGNLSYGYFWEISDDPSIFGGDLRPYFPKRASWWEPVGNAVLDQATTLTFGVN